MKSFIIRSRFAEPETVRQLVAGYRSVDFRDPEQREAAVTAWAVSELAGELAKVPGVTVNAAAPEGATLLVLEVQPEAGLQEQEYRITTEDAGSHFRIVGGNAAGLLYGVYELLYRWGFRYFSPDSGDAEYPAALDEPPAISCVGKPAFQLRGFIGNRRDTPEFLIWMARNKFNFWTAEARDVARCRLLGMTLLGGSHRLFEALLPPETYFARHPEYYALIDGKRSDALHGVIGDNICMSNSEAAQTFADNLAEALDHGELRDCDWVNVWPFDNGRYCQCEQCRRLGNPMRQLLQVIDRCTRTIRQKVARPVKLVVPAYHETLAVPDTPLPKDFDYERVVISFFPIERCYAHDIDAPECAEINRTLHEFYLRWTREPRWQLLMGEYYNVSAFAGIAAPFGERIAHDLPVYRKTGTRYIHYMHVPVHHFGLLALTNYFFAAYSFDIHTGKAALYRDFFTRRYHDAAVPMQEFYDILRQAMANVKPLKHYVGATVKPDAPIQIHALYHRNLNEPGHPDIFRTRHFTYSDDYDENTPSLLTTLELLNNADTLLDAILLAPHEPAVAMRLELDARRFRYTKRLVRFLYTLIRLRRFEAMNQPELARLEALELRNLGEALRGERDMSSGIAGDKDVLKSYLENGLTATWFGKTYAAIMETYGLDTPDTPGGIRRDRETDRPLA